MLNDNEMTTCGHLEYLVTSCEKVISTVRMKGLSRIQTTALGFLVKQCLHAHCILKIVNAVEGTRQADSYILDTYDYSSVYCIARVMFELDVVANSLLTGHASESELAFKLDYWEIHAVASKRTALQSMRSKNESLNFKVDEAVLSQDHAIQNLADSINGNSFYQSMFDKGVFEDRIKQAIAGGRFDLTKESLIARAEKTGIGSYITNTIYRYSSAFIHSTGYGLQQILTSLYQRSESNPGESGLKLATIMFARTFDLFLNSNEDVEVHDDVRIVLNAYVLLSKVKTQRQ